MRATADTLAHLTLALEELITTKGEKAVKQYRQNVSYANDQFTAFVWGVFHSLDRADQLAIIKNQGNRLEDRHLETVLKKALGDYK